MKRVQQGFTLIELMIVVAIIAILAAIAIPVYQNFVARSVAGAALAEITAGRTGVEELLVRNSAATDAQLQAASGLQLTGNTTHCTLSVDGNLDGSAVIGCTIVAGPAAVNGEFVRLTRTTAGVWSCTTNVPEDLRPSGCGAGT